EALRRVDRRLHLLLRNIDVQAQRELQHQHRIARRAGRRHLAQPLQLSALPLQRRRHRRRHHLRARPRIERQDLDRRIVHLRQRRHRQLRVSDNAHQHDGRHQQRRRNRTQNKRTGRAQGALLPLGLAAIGFVEMEIAALSCSLSKLLVASTAPGWIPVTCAVVAFVTPTVIGVRCALFSAITYTNAACPLCCTAALGISVAPSSVFTSSRTFTNWLGNNDESALANSARAFTVPVVVSIWLSSVNSVPVAICFCPPRSNASASSFARLRSCGWIFPRSSSATVNTAVIGWICVTTARTVPAPAITTLPGSTSRSPTRPVIGETMWQYSTWIWSYCTVASSLCPVPRSCATSFSWSSSVCLGIALRAHAA